jgi:hypothetical protein
MARRHQSGSATEVEIRFLDLGAEMTLVKIEHRGLRRQAAGPKWNRLGPGDVIGL